MSQVLACEEAYRAWKIEVADAKKKAREEFREAMSIRVAELSAVAFNALSEAVKEAISDGVTQEEIRFHVFRTNPLDWPEVRDAVGLPAQKRGRPAKPLEHGKTGTYSRGCRCEDCTRASREYQRNRNKKLKEGLR